MATYILNGLIILALFPLGLIFLGIISCLFMGQTKEFEGHGFLIYFLVHMMQIGFVGFLFLLFLCLPTIYFVVVENATISEAVSVGIFVSVGTLFGITFLIVHSMILWDSCIEFFSEKKKQNALRKNQKEKKAQRPSLSPAQSREQRFLGL